MNYAELEKLVTDTIKQCKAFSDEALQTMMIIAAHESMRGRYRRQVGAAQPALGLWQMERPTFDTVMEFSARWPDYARRCGYDPALVKFEDIENEDKLACIVARARLSMDSRPLPKTPMEQAQYALEFWNAGGKASAEKYYNDWALWRRG